MGKNVLYFPYINVPSSAWFTRMLLYWDKVGSIVPLDFIRRPELLGEHTRSLVEADLVFQVIPDMHLYRIPRIRQEFVEYLQSLEDEVGRRKENFANNRRTHIHMEKMGELADELIEMGLAGKDKDPWYYVETRTADDYMGYLALALGCLPDLEFTPITDQLRCLDNLAESHSTEKLHDREIAVLRLEVLDNVLPAPVEPLKAADIQIFKDRYGEQLTRFRINIEIELTALANMPDPSLRKRQLNLVKERMRNDVADIRDIMERQGWSKIVFGKVCGLLSAIPNIPTGPKLINAAYKAFGDDSSFDKNSPLAYAAFAQTSLLDRITRRIFRSRENQY